MGRSWAAQVTKGVTYVLLAALAVTMVVPFIWMLSSSFKPQSEIFRLPPAAIPTHLSLSNYGRLFAQTPFAVNLVNTAYIATTYALVALFLCSLGGFAFAKYRFPGREALFLILLGSLVIPFEVTMVPLYILYQRIGWIDTHWPLLIPGTANAFGIFFMRQIIRGVPDELIDSARIDGAGEFRIFTRIVLPVVTPALTSLGIIFFMSSWNSFLWPLVLLRSAHRLTAAVAVARLQGSIYTPYDLIMAGSVLLTLPLIVVFLVLQRRFIEGIMAGAVKA
jgi:ABC-type glycerol-3-phosphate transport system permease component